MFPLASGRLSEFRTAGTSPPQLIEHFVRPPKSVCANLPQLRHFANCPTTV